MFMLNELSESESKPFFGKSKSFKYLSNFLK